MALRNVLSLMTVCLLVFPGAWAVAQENAGGPPEGPKPGEAPGAPGADAGAPSAEPDADNDPNTVAISLNAVDIDQVIKFLSQITGKFVVKHKGVTAQITVYSPAEVPKDKAFALLCEALMLENVAVIEDDETIKLVPADVVKEVVTELLPAGTETLTGGIVKKVIPLRFADVAEIGKLIEPLLRQERRHAGARSLEQAHYHRHGDARPKH